MKPIVRIALIAMLAFLTACNLPGAQPSISTAEQQAAATLVAQTMQAVATRSAVTPFTSPVPRVTVAATATTAKATLSITASSTCRTGPSDNFATVTSFNAGTRLDLVGKNPESNYWQVKIPNGSDTCWVSGANATSTGDTSALPEATAQVSKPNVPAGPGALFYSFNCPFPAGGPQQITVDLTWPDKADNEKGYRLYRNGSQIADLPENSTSYSDTTNIGSGVVFTYQVEAYNDVGASPQATTRNGDPITCH